MLLIIKRDGSVVEFDRTKIENAVLAAFDDVDGQITDYAKQKAANIADYVLNQANQSEHELSVEEIQDLVEQGLMSTRRKDVARAYIQYRYERTKVREYNTNFMREVAKKLDATDIQNQNANVDEHSFGGRMGEANRALTKKFALDYCMSEMARSNHLNNYIYIHDLDSYAVGMHNCLTIPFDKLLAEGFNTRQTDVRPANSVNTAFQLIAVIFQLQSLQQFGGVSASHIDWTMVPYVRKSFWKHYKDGLQYISNKNTISFPNGIGEKTYELKEVPKILLEKTFINDKYIYNDNKAYNYALEMTRREVHQGVEGMYHNLNTLQSRSGNQLPFTSINYGTCTLPEGRMVTEEILNVSIEGLGKLHKTSIFPCGIFQCMKGVNRAPGDPNYDLFQLALKSTAQRLYPNYVNVDWSTNAGYDKNDPNTYVSTMGCRTYNGSDINAEPGVNPQTKDGRGNLAPVTILLPFLAMEARDRARENNTNIIDEFMKLLDIKLHEARDMLKERFEYMCSQSADSARFMYENGTMLGYHPEEGIKSALKHGTLVIGQLGMAETLQILIGCDHTESAGMELAKQIEQLYKDRCAQFKQEEKLNFGVYYTPAENLCYTAMKAFKKKYGEIPNVSENDYFTNSIHVPVWKHLSPFDKIDIEAELTGYSNAGCITYVELESSVKNNLTALEQLINYAMDKDIPYFALNIPVDTCLNCGYTDELNDACPMCGSTNIQRLRRVTGYLTGNYKTAFNKGKIQETEMRYKHSKQLNDWKR